MSEDVVRRDIDAFKDSTDAPDVAEVPARWFHAAVLATANTGGEAAVEIGVRLGGMSAILCAIARDTARDGFLVMSVDPWGDVPMFSPGPVGNRYGEAEAVAAKGLLSGFANSAVFRMAAHDFVATVLPSYRWWWKGFPHPKSGRYLSFVFLDGQHDPLSVAEEAAGFLPHIAPGGALAIDNTEACPEAVDLIARSPRYKLRRTDWRGPGGPYDYLRRACFEVLE